MTEPVRIYGVSDVAKAWGVTPERVRQLLRAHVLKCDLAHLRRADYVECYWYSIPVRDNGLAELIRQFTEEEGK